MTARDEPESVREPLGVGALQGASAALLVTGLIGVCALLLERVWPWLAWGYVLFALALGAGLAAVAWRVERSLRREVERVRRQYRPS